MGVRVELDDLQRNGFPMGAEQLVALDLVDTLLTGTDPATDLIGSRDRGTTWWRLELPSLPESPQPDLATTRRLRAAIRDLLDAHLDGRSPAPTSIEDVNAIAASVPTSPRLTPDGTGETRWHTEQGGNPALAAIAREVIELLSSPNRLAKLRRCANPACSMLFLAETTRRQWCTGNLCGNRARVARHYQRTRAAKAADR